MKTLTAPALAALAQPSVPIATLVRMDLTALFCVNSTSWNLTYASNVYTGIGTLGSVETIEDSPGEVRGLRLSLSGVPSSQVSLALSEQVQGKAITIYTAIFDRDTYQVLDVSVEWIGRLDRFSINDDGEICRLNVTAEHAGIDLLRPKLQRYTDADQQILFAGDRGFEFVIDQAERPVIWPSREFYKR